MGSRSASITGLSSVRADAGATPEPTSSDVQVPGLDDLRRSAGGGHPNIRVAVLDGPVNLAHPCLASAADRLRRLPTLVPETGPSDHGTHVASVIFGDQSVQGIAPACSGLILPVFTQGSAGLQPCSQTDLARAITQAVEERAHVVNISGGELTEAGDAIDFLADAVRLAVSKNVLVVAAVGNDGCDCPQVPAVLPGVLAVGAIDAEGQPLGLSNWGEKLSRQGVMAPGEGVLGASAQGGTSRMTGTSFATPIVTGLAALLLSRQLQLGGQVDPAAVRRAILETTRPCDPQAVGDCRRALAGYLNVPAAQQRILDDIANTVKPPEPVIVRMPAAFLQRAVPIQPLTTGEKTMPSESSNLSTAVVPAECEPAECEPSTMEPSALEPSTCHCASSEVTPSGETSPVSAALVAPTGGSSLAHGAGASAVRSASISRPSNVSPSGPREEAGFGSGQRVYALGNLYYDFGTEARRDYFVSQIAPNEPWKVYDPVVMAQYLSPSIADFKKSHPDLDMDPIVPVGHPEDANGLIWTLYIDSDPVYAIVPVDQYATISYVYLIEFLVDQVSAGKPKSPKASSAKGGGDAPQAMDGSHRSSTQNDTFRVGIAGHIDSSIQLLNGTVVPIIEPVTRGMYDWTIEGLAESLGIDPGTKEYQSLEDLLKKMYYELRNLGVSGQDRAKNFAATNVWQLAQAIKHGLAKGKQLDQISVAPSPICRRGSECWDISLTLFDPNEVYAVAREVFLFTVDVSDVVPVQVGRARTWATYSDPLA